MNFKTFEKINSQKTGVGVLVVEWLKQWTTES